MPETLSPRRFLTVDQVAEEPNVSDVQVRALLKSGDLRGIQIGGRGYLAQPIGSRQYLPRIQGQKV
ncbi:helix-turn-helix domain-containing protein [Pseudarthrobacter sp. MDT3-1]